MRSSEQGTESTVKAEIIPHGRGPTIKGTRLSVYTLIDYLLAAWPIERIASLFRITPEQVQAAINYIEEHKLEVMLEFAEILKREATRVTPPELQAKMNASHQRTQELLRRVKEAKARGEADIPGLIRRIREEQAKGNSNARNNGGQGRPGAF